MADLSKATIRWMRKTHPVGDVNGALEVGVRLTNIGTDPASTWDTPDYVVRAHVYAADGTYFENPTVEGESFVDPVAVGATADHVLTIVAAASGSPTASQLFHPDTLIAVDVYRVADATWLGTGAPGQAGQMYVQDALRDRLTAPVREPARRLRMMESKVGTLTVPASGLESDVLFFQQVSGATALLEEVVASVTERSTLDIYVKKTGVAEDLIMTMTLSGNERMSLTDVTLDPGEWIRVAVRPSSTPGEASVRLVYVNLPWEDKP